MLDDLEVVKGFSLDDRLLRARQAAEMLGVSPQTLAVWRCRRNNGHPAPELPYVKVGRRSIRYRLSDVKGFIEKNRRAEPEQPATIPK
jgi:predicted DNA-binding transcriptional regulator AlpA